MLKYKAVILTNSTLHTECKEKRRHVYFPSLEDSTVQRLIDYVDEESMMNSSLNKIIDAKIRLRKSIPLTTSDEVGFDCAVSWQNELRILLSNWLIENLEVSYFSSISEEYNRRTDKELSIRNLIDFFNTEKEINLALAFDIADTFKIPLTVKATELSIN